MIRRLVMEKRRKSNKPFKFYSLRDVLKETDYKDKSLYKNVINSLFKHAKEELYTKREVRLTNIGLFKIMKFKTSRNAIDYGTSKKLGQTIYYTNFHTQRLAYKISCVFFPRKTTHKFVPYRFLKRDLAKRIFTDDTF